MRLIDADALANKLIEIGNRNGEYEFITQTLLWHLDRAPTASNWIPVTEKLPAMGKSVLMCDIDGDIYLGHRTQCGYYYPDFCEDKIKDVRAWCELPEPYKGVTK